MVRNYTTNQRFHSSVVIKDYKMNEHWNNIKEVLTHEASNPTHHYRFN